MVMISIWGCCSNDIWNTLQRDPILVFAWCSSRLRLLLFCALQIQIIPIHACNSALSPQSSPPIFRFRFPSFTLRLPSTSQTNQPTSPVCSESKKASYATSSGRYTWTCHSSQTCSPISGKRFVFPFPFPCSSTLANQPNQPPSHSPIRPLHSRSPTSPTSNG